LTLRQWWCGFEPSSVFRLEQGTIEHQAAAASHPAHSGRSDAVYDSSRRAGTSRSFYSKAFERVVVVAVLTKLACELRLADLLPWASFRVV
jgi:hypothetical protein